MKTAMQELIDIIKNHADTCKGKDRLRVEKAYRDIVCAIDDFKLLEKEKQQIIEAITYGNRMEFYDGTETAGEQYIQKPLKTIKMTKNTRLRAFINDKRVTSFVRGFIFAIIITQLMKSLVLLIC